MKRLPYKQLAAYVLSGGLAAAVDIGLYLLLTRLGFFYVTASVASGVSGFISAFLFHKYGVFKARGQLQRHFVRYCLLGGWNLVAMNLILIACVELLGLSTDASKIVSNGSVVLWNFFLYKFFVYV